MDRSLYRDPGALVFSCGEDLAVRTRGFVAAIEDGIRSVQASSTPEDKLLQLAFELSLAETGARAVDPLITDEPLYRSYLQFRSSGYSAFSDEESRSYLSQLSTSTAVQVSETDAGEIIITSYGVEAEDGVLSFPYSKPRGIIRCVARAVDIQDFKLLSNVLVPRVGPLSSQIQFPDAPEETVCFV